MDGLALEHWSMYREGLGQMRKQASFESVPVSDTSSTKSGSSTQSERKKASALSIADRVKTLANANLTHLAFLSLQLR